MWWQGTRGGDFEPAQNFWRVTTDASPKKRMVRFHLWEMPVRKSTAARTRWPANIFRNIMIAARKNGLAITANLFRSMNENIDPLLLGEGEAEIAIFSGVLFACGKLVAIPNPLPAQHFPISKTAHC